MRGYAKITLQCKTGSHNKGPSDSGSVLHITWHNFEIPCNFCMIPGEVLTSGKGHSWAFAYKGNGYQTGILQNIRNYAKMAQLLKRVNSFTWKMFYFICKISVRVQMLVLTSCITFGWV